MQEYEYTCDKCNTDKDVHYRPLGFACAIDLCIKCNDELELLLVKQLESFLPSNNSTSNSRNAIT